jgi:hypothetical protein
MVVVGLLLGATGIAVASGDDRRTPSPPASANDGGGDGDSRKKERAENKRRDGSFGAGGGAKQGKWPNTGKRLVRGGPSGAALHGEFVVPAGDDSFQTLAVQRGEVTAVTAGSITLRSEDGFTRTYAINADTRVVKARGGGITSIAKGSDVHVVAVRQGTRLTAQLVQSSPAPGRRRDKPKQAATSIGAAT